MAYDDSIKDPLEDDPELDEFPDDSFFEDEDDEEDDKDEEYSYQCSFLETLM